MSVCPSPPQTPSSTPSPPCWSCLTMLSSVWPPAGTTLVLPLVWRTTSWRTSRLRERGEVQACFTDMLKRWLRGERATGGEERSWSTVLGSVQRNHGREAAWSIAGSCRQTVSCLVPSVVPPNRRRCRGLADLIVVLHIRSPSPSS